MQCPYYASCKAFGPFNGTCVCNEQVPNYEDQVCSTDDVTYQNTFSLQKDSCLKHRNIIFKKPGTCERKLKKKKEKKEKGKTEVVTLGLDCENRGKVCNGCQLRQALQHCRGRENVHVQPLPRARNAQPVPGAGNHPCNHGQRVPKYSTITNVRNHVTGVKDG